MEVVISNRVELMRRASAVTWYSYCADICFLACIIENNPTINRGIKVDSILMKIICCLTLGLIKRIMDFCNAMFTSRNVFADWKHYLVFYNGPEVYMEIENFYRQENSSQRIC